MFELRRIGSSKCSTGTTVSVITGLQTARIREGPVHEYDDHDLDNISLDTVGSRSGISDEGREYIDKLTA